MGSGTFLTWVVLIREVKTAWPVDEIYEQSGVSHLNWLESLKNQQNVNKRLYCQKDTILLKMPRGNLDYNLGNLAIHTS